MNDVGCWPGGAAKECGGEIGVPPEPSVVVLERVLAAPPAGLRVQGQAIKDTHKMVNLIEIP